MNYIKHLNNFYNKIQIDPEIAPCQIALYLALFQCWNKQRFENPIHIIRDEVMRLSKITSKSTYHRSMKILHNNQYIIYIPSYNPYIGSQIYFKDLTLELKNNNTTQPKKNKAINTVIDTPLEQTSPKKNKPINKVIDTPINTPIEPIYKHINNKQENINSLCKQAQIPFLIFDKNFKNNIVKNQSAGKAEMLQKEKSSAKKEKGTNPTLDQVKEFFQDKDNTSIEAEKFFYYFESNGWLVGGKTKMKNWKAAANNWMINATVFSKNQNNGLQKKLDTSLNKKYDEPL